jgi:hypothetical protein
LNRSSSDVRRLFERESVCECLRTMGSKPFLLPAASLVGHEIREDDGHFA